MILRGQAARRPTARTRGRGAAAIALAAVAAIGLAACSSSGSSTASGAGHSSPSPSSTTTASCSSSATKLTFWGWPAGYDLAVEEFNKTHPDVCVALENAGASTQEYTKLTDAIKAGNGAPDVATIEYFELPSFEATNSLVDLADQGIASAKKNEAPAAWSQVSQGSHVYAMPVDLGPMALFYNQKQFASAGLSVPTTWEQFASEAATLHRKDPKAAITNFDPESAQDVLALMQQYGAFPFTYTGGSKLGIHFTGAKEMQFAKYWQDLISAKEATTAADFSPAQWSAFDNGAAASRLSPAWGPVGMQLSIKNTIGDWQTAPLPQVTAGGTAAGNWGGSTLAVVKGTKHAKAATEFVKWFGGSDASWKILSGDVGGAFPGYLPLLDDTAFQQKTLKITGTTTPNTVFAAAAKDIDPAQFPPIMTAALTQWTSTFAGVTKGTETLQQAFTKFQSQMTSYAKSQGFTVNGS
ncbi:ABC transporter substrate-binding protein [Curtobacterium sp. MCBD17_034]|uniref:ABC transporter substrate-binding protein n=1 Tax=unclassified Curtobacterium TaxID=257496 RepID=UPI000DA6FC1C|nr:MULTISPECIES: extracellular solute-binding protein [unclassified Curtobacterium]PZF60332.1 ABC transporter substrate-binding protein [Curtobacterium sp. MCBD17_034]PZM35017.1 ABC transporter substrate-binding protein [Curtobacterium sp. MCBD17_031]